MEVKRVGHVTRMGETIVIQDFIGEASWKMIT
jgi:hypothetical protein